MLFSVSRMVFPEHICKIMRILSAAQFRYFCDVTGIIQQKLLDILQMRQQGTI